jgi:hypothetical protein
MARPKSKKDIRRFGTTLSGAAYDKLFRLAEIASKSASDVLEGLIQNAEAGSAKLKSSAKKKFKRADDIQRGNK